MIVRLVLQVVDERVPDPLEEYCDGIAPIVRISEGLHYPPLADVGPGSLVPLAILAVNACSGCYPGNRRHLYPRSSGELPQGSDAEAHLPYGSHQVELNVCRKLNESFLVPLDGCGYRDFIAGLRAEIVRECPMPLLAIGERAKNRNFLPGG